MKKALRTIATATLAVVISTSAAYAWYTYIYKGSASITDGDELIERKSNDCPLVNKM